MKNEITIRLLSEKDTIDVYNEVVKSRSYLSNLKWATEATEDSIKTFINSVVSSGTNNLYGIFNMSNFCGCIETKKLEESIDIGYWLGYDFRGQGIMQSALLKLKHLLKEDTLITAKIDINNIKSFKLLNRVLELKKYKCDTHWIYLKG